MINPGLVLLWTALISVSISMIYYLIISIRKNDTQQNGGKPHQVARITGIAFTVLITAACALLMYYLLTHNYLYKYVTNYTSTDLPVQYIISAFWAGQSGSFMLWVFCSAWFGVILMHKSKDMEPVAMLVYNINNLLLTILLIKQNPFATLKNVPADGYGLNMLLQDPWMVIHPPLILLGFALIAIPFAYAMAGLILKKYSEWIKPALPWVLFSFVALGAGNILGGFWAYKVLGWGGFWAWDPVENAGLLPWLVSMAIFHGMLIQIKRGKLLKTNILLAGFSYLLVIYCTFLTRSGVLLDFSVHSFSDIGITGWLIFFIAIFFLIFTIPFILRLKDFPMTDDKKPVFFFSREFGFIAGIIIITLSAIITGLGTSAPLITRLTATASKVSVDFYNNSNLPLMIIMLTLLCYIPFLTWGKNSFEKIAGKLIAPMIGAVISLGVLLYFGIPEPGILFFIVLAGAAAATNLFLFINLATKKIINTSGALTHLGIGIMFIGIVASSIYEKSETVLLPLNTAKNAIERTFTFTEALSTIEGNGQRINFQINVETGQRNFTAVPDLYFEASPDGQKNYYHPYIKRGIFSDLYISPKEYDPGHEEETDINFQIVLSKGEEKVFSNYKFLFTGFETSGMDGNDQNQGVSVKANITVSFKGGETVELAPAFVMSQETNNWNRAKLPGPEEAYILLDRIDATSKSIYISFEGLDSDAAEKNDDQDSYLVVEIRSKPGMTALWLGTVFMMLGGCIAIYRRTR